MKERPPDPSKVAHRILMPGDLMGGGPVVFTGDHVEFKGTRIQYDEVASVKYNLTPEYLRFVPAYQGLYFRIAARDREIYFFVKPAPAERIRERLPIFANLVETTRTLIEPILIRHLASQVIEHGARLEFSGLRITRAGIEKDPYYSGTLRRVPWTEKLHRPEYSEGKVFIYRDNGGVPVIFGAVPLEIDNAAILPDLVRALHKRMNAR